MTVITHRKTVIIDKEELKKLRSIFSVYGSKQEFSRSTGVDAGTLTRILERGKGNEKIVTIIKKYIPF